MLRKLKSLANYFTHKIDVNKESIATIVKTTNPIDKSFSLNKLIYNTNTNTNNSRLDNDKQMDKTDRNTQDLNVVENIIGSCSIVNNTELALFKHSPNTQHLNMVKSSVITNNNSNLGDYNSFKQNQFSNTKNETNSKFNCEANLGDLINVKNYNIYRIESETKKKTISEIFTIPLSQSYRNIFSSKHNFNKREKNYLKEQNSELKSNILLNRVSVIQYNANNPREDRHNAIQLKHLPGYMVAVFDGHGGNEVADYANKMLHKYFDDEILKTKDSNNEIKDNTIIDSINKAFHKIVILN